MESFGIEYLIFKMDSQETEIVKLREIETTRNLDSGVVALPRSGQGRSSCKRGIRAGRGMAKPALFAQYVREAVIPESNGKEA